MRVELIFTLETSADLIAHCRISSHLYCPSIFFWDKLLGKEEDWFGFSGWVFMSAVTITAGMCLRSRQFCTSIILVEFLFEIGRIFFHNDFRGFDVVEHGEMVAFDEMNVDRFHTISVQSIIFSRR